MSATPPIKVKSMVDTPSHSMLARHVANFVVLDVGRAESVATIGLMDLHLHGHQGVHFLLLFSCQRHVDPDRSRRDESDAGDVTMFCPRRLDR